MLRILLLVSAIMLGNAQADENFTKTETKAAGFPAVLTKPEGGGPVALMIAGSGPTDRDGNNMFGVKAGYMSLLAEDLARKGIASLRYDKRSVAGSQPVEREEDVTLSTFVDDAEAIYGWLAEQEIGPIILLGHSEGGLVALQLAERRSEVAGIVLLATPGRSLDETLRDQMKSYPEPLRGQAFMLIDRIKAGEEVTDIPAPLQPIFRPSVQPYLRTLFALEPPKTLTAIGIPALNVGGGNDFQVSEDDFKALAGVERVESRWFATMNHVLVDADADLTKNAATYAVPATALAGGLTDAIADFVWRNAKGGDRR
jgi:pimeloyl-ACP methyl ester carboxylesterase